MIWDYAEGNPFSDSTGNFSGLLNGVAETLDMFNARLAGTAIQAEASSQTISADKIISTDPPYFDNVGYSDLSDFFYVWLRRALQPLFPELFSTLLTPKAEELVAAAHRHGSKEAAEEFFLRGMREALARIEEASHPAFPVSIYYAFKQSETSEGETASSGWETFLEAAIGAGFEITGTWPIRTERPGRTRDVESNALASSIVLICSARSREANS